MSQITCTNMGTSHALVNNALLGCFYIKSHAATEMTCFSFTFNETSDGTAGTIVGVSGDWSWARLFGSHSPHHAANHTYRWSDTNRTQWTTRLECYEACAIATKPCLLSLQHWIWFECILGKIQNFGGMVYAHAPEGIHVVASLRKLIKVESSAWCCSKSDNKVAYALLSS